MAVTKIRKISSTVLLVIAALTVVVLAMFIFGGYVDPTAVKPEPKFTDVLFYTVYVVFGLTLLAMIIFAIVGFIGNLGDPNRRKSALGGLVAIIAVAILLGVTYAIGSTDRLSLSVDFQQYNTDFYLKFADMWIYSIYLMVVLCVGALIWGAIKGATQRGNK